MEGGGKRGCAGSGEGGDPAWQVTPLAPFPTWGLQAQSGKKLSSQHLARPPWLFSQESRSTKATLSGTRQALESAGWSEPDLLL